MKPNIQLLDCGGTITQQPQPGGPLRPGTQGFGQHLSALEAEAHVDVHLIERVDSTDMTTALRARLATAIFERAGDYDGFVVVHGTDTMVDTAAALAYMLQNLGKPVVLTGAQRPIFAPGSDGPANLANAVRLASMDLGEVVICFGERVIRGVAAVKENGFKYSAFRSHQVPDLGSLGMDVKLHGHRQGRNGAAKPELFTDFDTKVAYVAQTSGSDLDVLTCLRGRVSGVVLGGYGAGNVQTRLHGLIRQLVDSGVPVVVTTICPKGDADMERYQVGSGALAAGACSARDMTPHAAVQKLMYALGKHPGQGVRAIYDIIRTPLVRDVCP